MSSESASESSPCLDCGAEAKGSYCSNCGQKRSDPTRIPLKELFAEGLGNLLGLDSRLRRTLPLLLLKPGELTAEYNRGRRTRYVPPLRLFLFLSVALLTLMSFTDFSLSTTTTNPEGGESEVIAFSWNRGQEESSSSQITAISEDPSVSSTEAPLSPRDSEALEEGESALLESVGEPTPKEPGEETDGEEDDEVLDEEGLQRGFLDYLPQGLFLMTPLFGFYLFVLFRRRFPFYAPHFIFSLHYHAFLFALIIAVSGTRMLFGPVVKDGTSVVLIGSMVVYLLIAIRRFYTSSFAVTFFAVLALLVLHFITFLGTLIGVVAFVLWLG